jgi:folate-binding protein YgfZ
MHTLWPEHLRIAGAQFNESAVHDFGNPGAELRAAQDGTVVCALTQFSLLLFAGQEAQAFLHAQLSSDVSKINLAAAQYSSYCTAKGRMLANFLIWQSHTGFFAQLHTSLREFVQCRLTKFVLRSKVKISDAGNDSVCFGLAGSQAAALLQKHFGSLPQAALGVAQAKTATLIRLSSERFEIIAPGPEAPGIWNALCEEAKPVGSACWDWLTIRAGIPVITAATQENFVPQMANLDLIGAISFNKGCYPGQEIVARTQHLGLLKRRMYLAHVESPSSTRPGDEIFNRETEDQACGTIVNTAPAPGGGHDLLAIIQISSARYGEVHWQTPDGPVLQLLPLPYCV